MYQNSCKKCGSTSLHTEVKGNNVGLYCNDCGAWIKWLGKDELRAFEHAELVKKSINKQIYLNCYGFKDDKEDIQLGQFCYFKPLDSDSIFFGHMAGKVVDDFENMTFMYVLVCDGRYFFSRKIFVKPDDSYTLNDVEKYFAN